MTNDYVVPADLLARCVGRIELVQKVLNAFIRQIDADIPKLSAELRAGMFDDAARTAHRIKGSSANVAAEHLRQRAEQIEQLAREQATAEVLTTLNQLERDRQQFVERTASFLA